MCYHNNDLYEGKEIALILVKLFTVLLWILLEITDQSKI